ncbi:MAG TPA: hypothetical protein VFC03_22510, partial [Acidimicrobiales bacterium]|nr:hypothetical protein [Acidimicrobiales bacterium]
MGVRELVDETGGGPPLVEETGSCQSRMMFVTNHVLSGVLVGQVLADRPAAAAAAAFAAAFAVGVASHLALNAVPHWGCDLAGVDGPERFLRVAKRDGLLG